MKTIFNKTVREELITRIKLLDDPRVPHWGKMNLIQMIKHNNYWNGWILGFNNNVYKQTFIGKIFGKMALRSIIKDERPLDKNIPTSSQFKVKEFNGNLSEEKLKWIWLIKEYENYDNHIFIHDFFGRMTKEQIGILVYKHTDHHLRQFGA